MTDGERLDKILVDSIREAEKIYDEEEDTTNFPQAFYVLDRAQLAAEKLNERIGAVAQRDAFDHRAVW